MTLEEFLRLTRRHIVLIAVFTVLGVAAAVGALAVQPREYTASATAYVQVSADDSSDVSGYYSASQLATQKAEAYMSVFTSLPVAEAVINELGLTMTASELAGQIDATRETDSLIIGVAATASDPDQAQEIADAVVRATGDQVVELEGEDSPVQVVPMAEAALSEIEVSPQPVRYLAVGLVAGLLLGYALALVRDRFDTRLRTAADIEECLDVAVLGVIPQSKEIQRGEVTAISDFHTREAIRKLRTNLRYADVDHELHSVVVTSAVQGEGKSTVASQLAAAMAQAGSKVLLVDADLRRPGVARAFGAPRKLGLTQLLIGTASLEQVLYQTSIPGLTVMAAGEIPPNPSEVVGSHRMRELLEYLSRELFVIVDAPPLLAVTDAALIAPSVDGVLVVVSAGTTRAEQVQKSVESLERVHSRVLGVVLNRASNKKFSRLRYGDAEYGYGESRYGYASVYEGSSQVEAPAPVADPEQQAARTAPPPAAQSNDGAPAGKKPAGADGSRRSEPPAQAQPVRSARATTPSPHHGADERPVSIPPAPAGRSEEAVAQGEHRSTSDFEEILAGPAEQPPTRRRIFHQLGNDRSSS